MKNIYTIYSPGGHAHQGVYNFFNEAISDAKKLADKYPGEIFHVMEAINGIRIPEPEPVVIEVGDEIRLDGHAAPEIMDGMICEVVELENDLVFFTPPMVYSADKSKCTLLRKKGKEVSDGLESH